MIHSAEEFVRLRASQNPSEYRISANDRASEMTWLEVIKNHPDMKIWVIRNKTVPLSILRLLSDDPDPEIRSAIADKRKLDNKLFLRLAQDEDESVRQRIAYNKKTPTDVLKKLASDKSSRISETAKERLAESGGSEEEWHDSTVQTESDFTGYAHAGLAD